jgi:hypothetical protein
VKCQLSCKATAACQASFASSTSIRFTTAMISVRVVNPACSCSSSSAAFIALTAFASTSSSRAVRAGQLVVQSAGPARFAQQSCQRLSQKFHDTFMLRPCKFSLSGSIKAANYNGDRSNLRCHRLLPRHVWVYHSHPWVATQMADHSD